MPVAQRRVVFVVACFLMLMIFELVRKRKLREEYSWLWLLAGVVIMVASLVPYQALKFLAGGMGTNHPPAAIFFLGFVAVTLLCLQFSVRLSKMTEQIKNLGQKVALLEASQEEIDSKKDPGMGS